MRSTRVVWGLVLLFVLGAGIMSACGSAPAEPTEQPASVDGETLLQDRCTECHGLDRVTGTEKTRSEWENTVTRMVSRGAELNESEQGVLIDHLAEAYGP